MSDQIVPAMTGALIGQGAAWALTALLVTISFGQFQSSFAGYATRLGGIDTRGLGLAFAAIAPPSPAHPP